MLNRWLSFKPDAAWEDVVSALDENRTTMIIQLREVLWRQAAK